MNTLKSTDFIFELHFSKRVENSLLRHGIRTIGELIKLKPDDMLYIRNFGELSKEEVFNVLRDLTVIDVEKPWYETNMDKKETTTDLKPADSYLIENERLKETLKKTNIWIRNLISNEITHKRLHPKAKILEQTLANILEGNALAEDTRFHAFSRILSESITVCDELEGILAGIPRRDLQIIMHRFQGETLEAIGGNFGVSRERIRQLEVKAIRVITNRINEGSLALLRIQTAMLIGADFGLNLSYRVWAEKIKVSGLLGEWSDDSFVNLPPPEIMAGLLASQNIPGFPTMPPYLDIAFRLHRNGDSDRQIRGVVMEAKLPKEVKKNIAKHQRFFGAVSLDWLSDFYKAPKKNFNDLIKSLQFELIGDDWFIDPMMINAKLNTKSNVFQKAMNKMLGHCGALSVDDICSGLRAYISRTDFPTPPPNVMQKLLDIYGYTHLENGKYYTNVLLNEPLSNGEVIINNCFKEYGPVVHHNELTRAFLESSLSFPSLHGTLTRSPIFDKLDTGLYKVRGSDVTGEDILRAQDADSRIRLDPDISFDIEGNVVIDLTLGWSAVATGEIMTDKTNRLLGKWACHIEPHTFDDIEITDTHLKRIKEPMKFLDCKVGDRVRLTFNTWSRSVSMEKVENYDDEAR